MHHDFIWINVDLSSVGSSENHAIVTSQEIPQPSVTKISMTITNLKFHSNLTGGQWEQEPIWSWKRGGHEHPRYTELLKNDALQFGDLFSPANIQFANRAALYCLHCLVLEDTPRPRFANVFSIAIQIRWKFRFTLISILIQWSLQNFVHGTTAELSSHVQKLLWSDGQ